MEALGWAGAIWGSRYIEIYVAVASMAVALWMGLYLLRRGAGTPVGLLGACTALLLAVMYALEAMLDAPGITAQQYENLLRTQALFVPTPIAIWISLSFVIRDNHRITSRAKRLWIVVGVVGASQVWLRAFTNLHYDYPHISPSPYPWQDWWTPPGPAYPTFAVLVFAAFLWSSYNIFRPMYDEVGSLRALTKVKRFRPLFAGIMLFIISLGYLMVVYALDILAPELIGLAGVTLGVVAIGFGVFWHNAFVEEGRDISRDFLYSLAGISTILVLYAAIIYSANGFEHWGVGPMVVIVAALVITHSLHDVAYGFVDGLLERAGLSRLTRGHLLRREMLLRVQREKDNRDTLRQRLAVLLEELCREVATNRGFVALLDGDGFLVQATYGVQFQSPKIALPGLKYEGITTIPYDGQVGELKGIGVVVPLHSRDRDAGIIALGEKRYDAGEINRMIIHAETMQREIEALEVAEEINKLQRRLARLQRQQQPTETSEDDRHLVSLCAESGLGFRNASEAVAAATSMLEHYVEDPYALETSPFLKCTRVQSQVARSRDRSHAVAILEAEIANTIARMKPSRSQGYDWRRWSYLNSRYIDRYDKSGRRLTMGDIAAATRVSRKTLTRGHEKAIRDFVLAFLDPTRPSAIL